MHNPELRRAIQGAIQNTVDAKSNILLKEFMEELKMPPKLKSGFYDYRKLLGQDQDAVAVFDMYFPSFPMKVVTSPKVITKEQSSLHVLEGKGKGKDGLIAAYHQRIEENVDAAASRAIVMLIKLAYFAKPHVVHAIDPVAVNLFEYKGWRHIFSCDEYNYTLILQPLEFFLGHPYVSRLMQEYLENALGGSR